MVDLVSAEVGRPSRPSSEPLSGPLTFSPCENYFRITLSNVFMASPRDLCIQAEILSYQREWASQMRRKSENKLSRNLVVGCCGLALRWIGCGECLVGLFRTNPTQRNSFGPVAGLMLPTLSFCLQQLWSLLCLRHNCQVWE